MKRTLTAVFLFLPMLALASETVIKRVSAQEFTHTLLVNAPPQRVWSTLTDPAQLMKVFRWELRSPGTLQDVGDWVTAKIEADRGVLIVSNVKQENELRLAWEPDNGSFICQLRFLLQPEGRGTRLTYMMRYSESAPQPPSFTARQARDSQNAMARLKTTLETSRSAARR